MKWINNSEMWVLISATAGGDGILDNAPFSVESKEAMINNEANLISRDPYIAGRWLEACIEDEKASKILKGALENLGVNQYSITILSDFNGYRHEISNAVYAFTDIISNTIKTINAIGDSDKLSVEEKIENLGSADVFSPDKKLCDKIESLLSKRIKELFDSYFEGIRDSGEEATDLGALALALDVCKDPLEWIGIIGIYESKKFGENIVSCKELRQVIGGYLNASY